MVYLITPSLSLVGSVVLDSKYSNLKQKRNDDIEIILDKNNNIQVTLFF